MRTSISFLYESKTGNFKYLDKNKFVEGITSAIAKQKNTVFGINEIKKTYILSYKEIVKKYSKEFKKLTSGIYALKADNGLAIICLIDKQTIDFENFCKKNKWKWGKEVKNIEKIIKKEEFLVKNDKKFIEKNGKDGIIYNNNLNYKPKESREELISMNKKLLKKVAVASLAALIAMPNITGLNGINSVDKVYAGVTIIDYTQTPIYAESGYYPYLGAAPIPSTGWIKDGTKDELGHDNYVNALVFITTTNKLSQYSKETLTTLYGIDPDLGIMDPTKIASAENQAHIQYTKNLLRTPKDINPYDKENPLYKEYGASIGGQGELFKDGNGWLWDANQGAVLYKNGQVVQKQSEVPKPVREMGAKEAGNGLYTKKSYTMKDGKKVTQIAWLDINENLVNVTYEDGWNFN